MKLSAGHILRRMSYSHCKLLCYHTMKAIESYSVVLFVSHFKTLFSGFRAWHEESVGEDRNYKCITNMLGETDRGT